MKVYVAVPTYGRAAELRRLLQGINSLAFVHSSEPELTILVVDNNPNADALEACRKIAADFRWPLIHVHEKRRGISQARNRALAEAAGKADFLAFLDDDEIPSPGWLDELLHIQRLKDAHIVCGPVLPDFSESAPHWIKRDIFFRRNDFQNGELLDSGRSGNTLIKMEVIERENISFDERLGFAGGEDSKLFVRLSKAGYRIHWATQAIVKEIMPDDRCTAHWLRKRWYRLGNTTGILYSSEHGNARGFLVNIVSGGLRVAVWSSIYSLYVLLWPAVPTHRKVLATCKIWRGMGITASALGFLYEPYK